MRVRLILYCVFFLCPALWLRVSLAAESSKTNQLHWWKGNLHTHSFWSDGDDFPEMIADWYKQHGYNFLVFSDHNILSTGEKWMTVTNDTRRLALKKCLDRYGDKWVEQREERGIDWVRLKNLAEFRSKFEESGRFLLMQGEEITARYLSSPVHLGAINIVEEIQPRPGTNVLEVMQNNVDAVAEQRKKTGQPMFPHINHPNFGWAITAEELMQVKREKFFEIYNGHPLIHNDGDDLHAGTERVWDICLTERLTRLKLGPFYGLATDDSHNYHEFSPRLSNSGRGWIVVRAGHLSGKEIIAAMETGDFYSSSGVRLKEVQRKKKTYMVEIEPENGVTYTIQFIGTRKGFEAKSEPVRTATGAMLRVTHRYSSDIGAILEEIKGTSAIYNLKGDEIYVRAKVISSKPKENAKDEFETAWTQPLVTGVK